jgi:cyclophilin family peptidyl-prolyl cis-trans isomerase
MGWILMSTWAVLLPNAFAEDDVQNNTTTQDHASPSDTPSQAQNTADVIVKYDDTAPCDESAVSEAAAAETEPSKPIFANHTVYKIYREPHPMTATIETTLGTLCCDLFIDDHPQTVLNFKALATGKPPWTDTTGFVHHTPYYDDLPWQQREKNAFVVSGEKDHGTNFTLSDERCATHHPVAGSLAMVQAHPSTASTRFMLLARDIPEFYGMYTIFGQCHDLDLIQKLTREESRIKHIQITDQASCK